MPPLLALVTKLTAPVLSSFVPCTSPLLVVTDKDENVVPPLLMLRLPLVVFVTVAEPVVFTVIEGEPVAMLPMLPEVDERDMVFPNNEPLD